MISILAANIVIYWYSTASTGYKACIKLPADTVWSCVAPSCQVANDCNPQAGMLGHNWLNMTDDAVYDTALEVSGVRQGTVKVLTKKKVPDSLIILQQ